MIVEQNPKIQDDRVQYQLQVQASQIQNVLNLNHATTTVTGGIVDDQSITFDLRSSLSSGIAKLSSFKDEFKKALGVEGIRLNRDRGLFQLEVIRPIDAAVPLLDLMAGMSNIPACTAVLGLADDGSAITHTFAADGAPNILIYGDKNSGKTNLLRTIVASLAFTNRQADVQLIAINPTAADSERRQAQNSIWNPLNYVPHLLTDVVTRQTEIAELMQFLVREMEYRDDNGFISPRIIVLIDQAATVLERGGREVNEAVLKIAERGARSGMHIILATRRPQRDRFGPHLMTNLQAHFVGQIYDEKRVYPDQPASSRANSLLGEGDFLTGGLARPKRFQAAYLNDYDLHMGLSRLYRNRPILLAKPVSTRTRLNPGNIQTETSQSFAIVEGVVTTSKEVAA
ncbi:MAG: FtsK/SpoIIIE domain-containing protein [Candidatus Promineifilaceae bacterium]|nr:FtsK/SpoIIIE domain-containing protein [Candidatus Promineifilaceae bacterium]